MRNKAEYLFLSKVFNPLVVALYGIFCFNLYSLSQYGALKKRAPVIIGLGFLLALWFLMCAFKHRKKQGLNTESKVKTGAVRVIADGRERMPFSKAWVFIACAILLGMTLFTVVKIYQSALPYQGKLSWHLNALKNRREIPFKHNNIYKDGVRGIFEDIEDKIILPRELYLSSDFRLKFRGGGTIVSFDTSVYGKDKKGLTKSFLISYDQNKSNKISVYLNGVATSDFSKGKKLQPLMQVLQRISLEDSVSRWNENQYGILYSGVRNWGYNTDGIYYVNEAGNVVKADTATEEILGYSVSVYVPGKESLHSPIRFIYRSNDYPLDESTKNAIHDKEWEVGYSYNEGEETFFINKNLGYQLSVVDAALGSRFYALLETKDGGKTWETINADPYLNHTGVSSGITFINESLGFIGLSHSGGVRSELYRTTDGGLSYKEVSLPVVKVSLGEGRIYNPFDFPGMPYEENGKLFLLVGQGQDGDYKGGAKALYQSADRGETWDVNSLNNTSNPDD